jgi:hypothetical protein
MPAVRAFQHLYSSVERGYAPGQGRGYQTVAVSRELAGTEDLAQLEKASFYALRPERRAAGAIPVRETFFRLPSGRLAVGRTVAWGSDSMGREGNYLAHHLVLDREALEAAGGNPFLLLDAAGLAAPGTDLTPRDLPPLEIETPACSGDPGALKALPPELAAALAAAAVEKGDRPLLLIGTEPDAGALLRGLLAVLAPEERLAATFCTHFYQSEHLRPLFRLAAVGSRAEAPSEQEHSLVFNLDTGEFPSLPASDDYSAWLAGCVRSGGWEEIRAFNRSLARLRSGEREPELDLLSGPAALLLWKRDGERLIAALKGRPGLISTFLRELPSAEAPAKALLALSPAALSGPDPHPEITVTALTALREAAPPRLWRQWVRTWKADPLLAPFLADADAWWTRFTRKLPRKGKAESEPAK